MTSGNSDRDGTADEPAEPGESTEPTGPPRRKRKVEGPELPSWQTAPRREERETPLLVRYALYVWITAGVVGVVNAVMLLVNKQRVVEALIEANTTPEITEQQIADGTNAMLWLMVIVAVTFAILFGLFAYKAQQGTRRSRLMLTSLTLIVVVFYFFFLSVLPGTFLGMLSAMLCIAGVVLLYVPKSAEFFRADTSSR